MMSDAATPAASASRPAAKGVANAILGKTAETYSLGILPSAQVMISGLA